MEGHTYLDIPPSPELLALPNPYDPVELKNIPFLYDAVFYNEHYYVYFGAVPALVPWIPVKWLSGISLDDRQLAFIFCVAGTYYLVWLLTTIAWRQSSMLQWGIACAVIATCFGTAIPQMLHQKGIYDVPIAGAYCFTALGLLFLWSINNSIPLSDFRRLLASLCFGLAAGCRMLLVFNVILLLAIWITDLQILSTWREKIRKALYLSIPWSLCIAAIAAYNYARFGSVFETGMRYQINSFDFHDGYSHYWDISRLWPNFYAYFLQPFPLATWLHWQPDFGTHRGLDTVHGLWINSPFSLWSLWFFLNIRACKSWLGNGYNLSMGLTLYTLVITILMLLFRSHMNRYMVDFSPLIMVLAALGYIHALKDSSKRWQPLLLAAGGITALWSAYIGIVSAAPWWM